MELNTSALSTVLLYRQLRKPSARNRPTQQPAAQACLIKTADFGTVMDELSERVVAGCTHDTPPNVLQYLDTDVFFFTHRLRHEPDGCR
jgi:hypothetical protein